ncbi:multidrug effflux MFS transporter [Sphingomonas sp. BAUL-RG-20F-R05-02]|uniref:multidrug effflux MFS transporter n=1 Tax=Sphingomonas sp. BAUL-RG-20F-R05-02 TaxID=2914830 RepID=UPI0028C3E008|nr:multidrug effflux MFS transporter [Sphingomonas sp. BAUL-RG-20F-R05-02]
MGTLGIAPRAITTGALARDQQVDVGHCHAMSIESPPRAPNTAPIPFYEFVALVAALMSLGALGIDSMLPALPDIGRRLGADSVAERSLVVTVFVVGFGLGQIVQGPLTDRHGRRPILIGGLAGYIVCCLLAGLAGSFTLLLIARFIGGVSIAAGRVVTIALVRDCFTGRAMAQVSSLAFMVFMAAPILAPSVGQLVLLAGSWRLIFEVIAGLALIVLSWFAWRMPETLAPANRLPLSIAQLVRGYRLTLTDRASFGYMIAGLIVQGALFGYIGLIEPIMEKVFHAQHLLGPVFAASAGAMAVANLLNSRIVMRIGMRRISQAALVVMTLAAAGGLIADKMGSESLILFVALQALAMAGYGLAGSNMSAMAMENMGAIAGTAASLQGALVVTGGAVIGSFVASFFDGTTTALHAGFFVAGLLALGIAAIVERGRLFRPS